jgi:hypothetical protein
MKSPWRGTRIGNQPNRAQEREKKAGRDQAERQSNDPVAALKNVAKPERRACGCLFIGNQSPTRCKNKVTPSVHEKM